MARPAILLQTYFLAAGCARLHFNPKKEIEFFYINLIVR